MNGTDKEGPKGPIVKIEDKLLETLLKDTGLKKGDDFFEEINDAVCAVMNIQDDPEIQKTGIKFIVPITDPIREVRIGVTSRGDYKAEFYILPNREAVDEVIKTLRIYASVLECAKKYFPSKP